MNKNLLVLALLPAGLGLAAGPASLSPTAGPAPSSGPQALSQGASPAEAPVQGDGSVEDADASPSAAALGSPDLGGVSTAVLAKLSANLSADTDAVYYEADQDLPLQEPAAGAWKVDAVALYDELAHRLVFAEDKGARQALSLAILGGDERAAAAKRRAYAAKRGAGAAQPASLSATASAGVSPAAGALATTLTAGSAGATPTAGAQGLSKTAGMPGTSTTARTGDKP